MSELILHVRCARWRPARTVTIQSQPSLDLASIARDYYRSKRLSGVPAVTARMATIGVLSTLHGVTVSPQAWVAA